MHGKFHALAHKLRLQRGEVTSWWGVDDFLWIGFRCSTCGHVSGAWRTTLARDSADLHAFPHLLYETLYSLTMSSWKARCD